MNCRQMTDLMQRSLDHDITESEQQTMVMHFRQCPECSAFFERLQLVSDELEALPLVTPPYSIVDKILPQLDELLQDPGYSAALEEPQPEERGKVRKIGVRSWIAYGGTAAAAILLGAFLYQHGNFSAPAKSAGATMDKSMQAAAKNADPEALQGFGFNKADTPTSPIPSESGDSPMASATPDPAAAMYNSALSTDATSGSGGGQGASSVRKFKDENHNADKDTKAGILGSPTPADAGEKSITGDNAVVKPGVIMAPAKGVEDSPSDVDTSKSSANEGLAGGPYTGTGSDSTLTLSSVTGKYIASIEGQKVTVRDDGNRTVFVSTMTWGKNDRVDLTLWYNDYQLSYSVIRESGIQEKYVIDLLNRTEFQR
ncbi:anti-sigma factor [Gorillibacterium massiliense]|uniref:anti-sigma factor n=1 Tax=Gorillibacterium massiliense TaxID=1280390 RepID=UPI000593C1BD|nr:zf-HC2 domain-containing protein [Gorillibacterium massiliense]